MLFKIETNVNLPTLVLFGGIHGNERAGVVGIQHIKDNLDLTKVKGNIYGILGNISALKYNQRYLDTDFK